MCPPPASPTPTHRPFRRGFKSAPRALLLTAGDDLLLLHLKAAEFDPPLRFDSNRWLCYQQLSRIRNTVTLPVSPETNPAALVRILLFIEPWCVQS